MKKTGKTSASLAPSHFFAKQLAGEEPPTFAAMERLYQIAASFVARKPWNVLDESELVLLKGPAAGELCYCSVMGALGEVFSLHAYLGDSGYRVFKRLESGEHFTMDDFFADHHSLYLEIVPASQLEPPDHELLKALGITIRKGERAPIYRSIRPGYHPWFVTQAEAETLAECLRATTAMSDICLGNASADYWAAEGSYPLLTRVEGSDRKPGYRIELLEVGSPAPQDFPPVTLDPARLRPLKEAKLPSKGTVELDHFYTGTPIGGKDERKMCMRLALVLDADSAFAFPPEVAPADAATADVLSAALLRAIEAARVVPREVRVRTAEFKAALDPLAQELGLVIRVSKSLPALEKARDLLLEMVSWPGAFRPN